MKAKCSLLIFSLLLIFILSSALIKTLYSQSREEKLQQLKSRTDIKVTEIEKDIFKIEYPDGQISYEYVGEYIPVSKEQIIFSPNYDSTIIDLTTIDTSLFYNKYSFWQEVNIGSPYSAPPLLADVNNNNLPEIYGIMKDYTSDFSEIVIMEVNLEGVFDSIFSYDSTSTPRTIYDIDRNGLIEIPFRRYPSDSLYPGHSWLFFTQTSDTSLATDLSFTFFPFPNGSQNQLNNNTFGDWDGDEFIDQIFIRDCCPQSIYIYEYNPKANNFDSIYYYDPSQYSLFWSGFAIGDFDQDGYTEFFAGSVNGKVVAIENCGDNCYRYSWNGMVETSSAYLYAATDDLDKNGKPELWIGGYHSGLTRLTIFEANGDDNYEVVGKVDLIGDIGWYAKNMQVLDVDKDGKDEIMVCIDQHVVILKFNGTENHHSYEVLYMKRNDLANSGKSSIFYGATMYDVTNDGYEDIIIHMNEIISNVGMRLFTYIYKNDFLVDVKNIPENFPEKFFLSQNYPNPFNPITKIEYALPSIETHHDASLHILLKVFDVLGKEIVTLVNEKKPAGSYEVEFDGSNLSSGVYYYKLQAGEFVQTRKMVLVK